MGRCSDMMGSCSDLLRCRRAQSRNVSLDDDDASDPDQEVLRNLWKRKRIIPPNGLLKHRWDRWMMLLVSYSSLEIPLTWAFDVTPPVAQMVVNYLLDLFFWGDILVSLRTTFRKADSTEVVVDSKEVMNRYLKSMWFASDLLAAFPMEIFVAGMHNVRETDEYAGLRLIRWFFRMLSFMGKPDKSSAPQKPMTNVVFIRLARVARLFTYFLFFAHFVACFWWALGIAQVGTLTFFSDYSQSQIDTWLRRPKKMSLTLGADAPLSQAYFSSLYWALSTLMKTAWITPGTALEKLYGSVVVFLGAIIFAFILASVSAVVNAFDESNAKRREKISTMLRFASTRKLTARVRANLLSYVDAEWSWTGGVDPPAFLRTAGLPTRLRMEMLRSMHKELCECSPLLKGAVPPSIIGAILNELVPQAVIKKATLIQAGELCFETFLLVKGSLNVIIENDLLGPMDEFGGQASQRGSDSNRSPTTKRGSVARASTKKKIKSNFKVLERQGQCVGLWSPYITPWRAPYTVTAIKLSHLFGVRSEALKRILDELAEDDTQQQLLSNLEKECAQVVGNAGLQAQMLLHDVQPALPPRNGKPSIVLPKASDLKPTAEEEGAKASEEAAEAPATVPAASPPAEAPARRKSERFSDRWSSKDKVPMKRISVGEHVKLDLTVKDKLEETDYVYARVSKTTESLFQTSQRMPLILAAVQHLVDPSAHSKPSLKAFDDEAASSTPRSARDDALAEERKAEMATPGNSSNAQRYLNSKLAAARKEADEKGKSGVTEKSAMVDEGHAAGSAAKAQDSAAMVVAM